MEEKKKKKHCFARCKSKSNKENSSLMCGISVCYTILFTIARLDGGTTRSHMQKKKRKEDEDKLIAEHYISDIRSDELHLSEVLL